MKKIIVFILLIVSGVSCEAQTKKTMPDKSTDPLSCDPQKGICELPGHSHQSIKENPAQGPKPIRMIYFTDPICSACWSIEPQLRKLFLEYGKYIDVEYHMGGLLPSWEGFNGGGISKPSDVAHHWEEMSAHFDMPIDGSVWIDDPLPSSYPPCIAYKAAEIQDKEKASKFLRRIKEMVFLEKKNITKWEHIQKAAESLGLDTTKLRTDYNNQAQQLFRNDLNLLGQYGVRGFPAIYFTDNNNNRLTVYGFSPYSEFEQTIKKLLPGVTKTSVNPDADYLFSVFPSYTTKEFTTLTGLSKEAAEKTLNAMVTKGTLEKFQSKNGVLWTKK